MNEKKERVLFVLQALALSFCCGLAALGIMAASFWALGTWAEKAEEKEMNKMYEVETTNNVTYWENVDITHWK